ncbi:MAG TPA: alpha/beta hydrolase [Sedimentisphaerales bacterium]|nr:alpha/beta hydrolase [Sedimentisphaerales bacterium]
MLAMRKWRLEFVLAALVCSVVGGTLANEATAEVAQGEKVAEARFFVVDVSSPSSTAGADGAQNAADSPFQGSGDQAVAKPYKPSRPKQTLQWLLKAQQYDRKKARKTLSPPPTFVDVTYGPDAMNVLDLWQAKSRKPSPVLVFIHGGGFALGDKRDVPPFLLRDCLSAGISLASVNYRFSTQAPYPAPMHDCARAVQFLRHHAKKWNLDPARVAADGPSAGAGIAVWLAFHKDLADSGSSDPVLRQSTRLSCAVATQLQSTYDARAVRTIVPGDAYANLALKILFGLPETWDWDKDKVNPELDALLKDSSPIMHLAKDSPPVYVMHLQKDNVDDNIHHPNFGKVLKEAMDKMGIECVRHMDTDYETPALMIQDQVDFVKKHFGMTATAPTAAREAPMVSQQSPRIDGGQGIVPGGRNGSVRTPAQAAKGRRGPAGPPMEQGMVRKVQHPPTFADVKYGPGDADVLDLWQAKSDKPAPLLMAIHGGGFRQGSKDQFSTVLFDECLAAGISFATIEYRLSQVAPYPAQMHDCARAVQFLRHNARKWNLDPERLASTGGSAGAGISVWLAFHDDMANPNSSDPVERESTRLTCALVTGLQSTYDPREIRKIVPGKAYDAAPIKQLFGLPESWNWATDRVDAALDARLKDASPVTHLTKDDVPVFVVSYQSMNVPGDPHHSNFAKHLKEQMDKVGLECVIRMDTDYPGGMAEAHRDMARWMKKHFGMK